MAAAAFRVVHPASAQACASGAPCVRRAALTRRRSEPPRVHTRRRLCGVQAISFAQMGLLYARHVTPADSASITLVACGLALSTAAFARLGLARTYFGSEMGVCEPKRIRAFPYGYEARRAPPAPPGAAVGPSRARAPCAHAPVAPFCGSGTARQPLLLERAKAAGSAHRAPWRTRLPPSRARARRNAARCPIRWLWAASSPSAVPTSSLACAPTCRGSCRRMRRSLACTSRRRSSTFMRKSLHDGGKGGQCPSVHAMVADGRCSACAAAPRMARIHAAPCFPAPAAQGEGLPHELRTSERSRRLPRRAGLSA